MSFSSGRLQGKILEGKLDDQHMATFQPKLDAFIGDDHLFLYKSFQASTQFVWSSSHRQAAFGQGVV